MRLRLMVAYGDHMGWKPVLQENCYTFAGCSSESSATRTIASMR